MTWRVRLSRSARRDVSQALEWTLEKFGSRQHDTYQLLIADALTRIGTDPECRISKHRDEIHPRARTLHIAQRGKPARHFFLYRIHDDGWIDIGRFLHDAMDLTRHLPEGFAAEDD